ncbi:MAG: polysaccharide biosynthesis C-terminal domain-containing protein, partial [Clostridia bacterium]|nr:polysaccharide biosynthesis C-terminal domain-containing protein [Clostridia bacterium]
RYRAIGETVLNLALNIVLGKLFGVYGIIAATIISLFLCNYLWSVGITFRLYFSMERRKDYYLYQGKQSILVMIACFITYGICEMMPVNSVLIQLVIRAVVCLIVPNTLFYLVYRKSELFLYAKRKILGDYIK